MNLLACWPLVSLRPWKALEEEGKGEGRSCLNPLPALAAATVVSGSCRGLGGALAAVGSAVNSSGSSMPQSQQAVPCPAGRHLPPPVSSSLRYPLFLFHSFSPFNTL